MIISGVFRVLHRLQLRGGGGGTGYKGPQTSEKYFWWNVLKLLFHFVTQINDFFQPVSRAKKLIFNGPVAGPVMAARKILRGHQGCRSGF